MRVIGRRYLRKNGAVLKRVIAMARDGCVGVELESKKCPLGCKISRALSLAAGTLRDTLLAGTHLSGHTRLAGTHPDS